LEERFNKRKVWSPIYLNFIQIQNTDVSRPIKKKNELLDVDRALANIWTIGGKRGWYYAYWLWQIRGFIDKMAGWSASWLHILRI
jgi:hypothetical protein